MGTNNNITGSTEALLYALLITGTQHSTRVRFHIIRFFSDREVGGIHALGDTLELLLLWIISL